MASDTLETIRLYIGTEEKTEIARKVLECSILEHTDANVRFTPMIGREWEYARDLKVGTGFSLRRWMIAAACNFEGVAVYLDADQLVMGDVRELVADIDRPLPNGNLPVVLCTWQPDKFNVKPAPQTSVMAIHCGRARGHWGFDIGKVEAHLRANPTKDAYAAFMHADWLRGRIGVLPVEWNHLNVATKATKLLHYTKEPEQPWYKPDHPLAGLWQHALTKAIRGGAVTNADLEAALAKWQVKEDWRATNGLHPHYRRFVVKEDGRGQPRRDGAATSVRHVHAVAPSEQGTPGVLWVTSFNRALHEASGRNLIASFRDKQVTGTLLAATEEVPLDVANAEDAASFAQYDLGQDACLRDWLARNVDIIPAELGGNHDGVCRCPGGPHDAHSKRHRQPCVGQWFNRHAARWFRKVAALNWAAQAALRDGHRFLIWVDADCEFTARVDRRTVEGWFRVNDPRKKGLYAFGAPPAGVGLVYLRSKRPVLEAGVVGYNLSPGAPGGAMLAALVARFRSGAFRHDPRWDDCFQLERVIAASPRSNSLDLAHAVGKDHADVVPHSPFGPFLKHRKGHHSRVLGIFT